MKLRSPKLTLHPEQARANAVIAAVALQGVPSEAVTLYHGRRNGIYRLGSVCIKAFRVPPWVNRVAYGWLRPGKALRSWRNGRRLLALGFDTPEPLGYAQWQGPLQPWGGRLMGRSYYFCRFHPGQTLRDMHLRPDFPRVARALGREMARLHRAGVWNRDYSPGNILLADDPATGEPRLSYVDINRITFGEHRRSRLMRMFRALTFDTEALAAIAREYAAAAGLPPEQTVAEALAQHHRYLAHQRRKDFFKHLWRPRQGKY